MLMILPCAIFAPPSSTSPAQRWQILVFMFVFCVFVFCLCYVFSHLFVSCNLCTTWFHLSCIKVTKFLYLCLCFMFCVFVLCFPIFLSRATYAPPGSTSTAQRWQSQWYFCVSNLLVFWKLCNIWFYLSYTQAIKSFLCLCFFTIPPLLSMPMFCLVQLVQYLTPPFHLLKMSSSFFVFVFVLPFPISALRCPTSWPTCCLWSHDT